MCVYFAAALHCWLVLKLDSISIIMMQEELLLENLIGLLPVYPLRLADMQIMHILFSSRPQRPNFVDSTKYEKLTFYVDTEQLVTNFCLHNFFLLKN